MIKIEKTERINQTKKVYIAEDGTEFDYELDCVWHECKDTFAKEFPTVNIRNYKTEDRLEIKYEMGLIRLPYSIFKLKHKEDLQKIKAYYYSIKKLTLASADIFSRDRWDHEDIEQIVEHHNFNEKPLVIFTWTIESVDEWENVMFGKWFARTLDKIKPKFIEDYEAMEKFKNEFYKALKKLKI